MEVVEGNDCDRFHQDLEFIQNLSNAAYLHRECLSQLFSFSIIDDCPSSLCLHSDLAKNQYFDDPSFINYLKYLRYWKEPSYIIYIQYSPSSPSQLLLFTLTLH
jgi:hypothetical protein